MTSIDPHAVAIGSAVRGAIAQAGLSQLEVADRSGISLATLSRRINGALPFTWSELVQVGEMTGTTASELGVIAERIAAKTRPAVTA